MQIPCFFPASKGNFGDSETSSHMTPSSSGESANPRYLSRRIIAGGWVFPIKLPVTASGTRAIEGRAERLARLASWTLREEVTRNACCRHMSAGDAPGVPHGPGRRDFSAELAAADAGSGPHRKRMPRRAGLNDRA